MIKFLIQFPLNEVLYDCRRQLHAAAEQLRIEGKHETAALLEDSASSDTMGDVLIRGIQQASESAHGLLGEYTKAMLWARYDDVLRGEIKELASLTFSHNKVCCIHSSNVPYGYQDPVYDGNKPVARIYEYELELPDNFRVQNLPSIGSLLHSIIVREGVRAVCKALGTDVGKESETASDLNEVRQLLSERNRPQKPQSV